jgi:hypothetical protein
LHLQSIIGSSDFDIFVNPWAEGANQLHQRKREMCRHGFRVWNRKIFGMPQNESGIRFEFRLVDVTWVYDAVGQALEAEFTHFRFPAYADDFRHRLHRVRGQHKMGVDNAGRIRAAGFIRDFDLSAVVARAEAPLVVEEACETLWAGDRQPYLIEFLLGG